MDVDELDYTPLRLTVLSLFDSQRFVLVRVPADVEPPWYQVRARTSAVALQDVSSDRANTVLELFYAGLVTGDTEDEYRVRRLTVNQRGFEVLARWRERVAQHHR